MIHAALHKKSSTKCKGNFGPIFISIRFLQNCFFAYYPRDMRVEAL